MTHPLPNNINAFQNLHIYIQAHLEKVLQHHTSDIHTIRYRRSDNICPFTRVLKPSGSDWAATELNWLEVSFKEDLPLTKVFTAARPLVAGTPVDEYLKVTLELPWDQTKDPAGNFSYLNVYGALRHLQTHAIEDVVVGQTPRIASSSQADSQEAAISPRSDTYENSLRLDDEPGENQVRSAYEADDASDEGKMP